MGGKKTDTVTNNSQPPSYVQSALKSFLPQIQQTANTPLSFYQGQIVAPFSDMQNQAFAGIPGTINAAQPDINSATALAQQGTGAVTPDQWSAGAIQNYMNPYTQDVINATQAQFNLGNAQQQAQLTGNAASQGALGGDRVGVAQAQLAGQQQAQQAPVIAGLEQSNYQQATGEFNTEQQTDLAAQQANAYRQLYGAGELGNLGELNQGTQLTGLGAELNAGSLQQQQAQAESNVPYEEFLQQQQYPFYTTGFEGSELGQLAGAAGGTSTQTSPGPNLFSELGGLGLGIAGLDSAGVFGSGGISGLFAGLARGGKIGKFGPGGAAPSAGSTPGSTSAPSSSGGISNFISNLPGWANLVPGVSAARGINDMATSPSPDYLQDTLGIASAVPGPVGMAAGAASALAPGGMFGNALWGNPGVSTPAVSGTMPARTQDGIAIPAQTLSMPAQTFGQTSGLVSDIGDAIGDAATGVGDAIGDAASSVGDFFGGLFDGGDSSGDNGGDDGGGGGGGDDWMESFARGGGIAGYADGGAIDPELRLNVLAPSFGEAPQISASGGGHGGGMGLPHASMPAGAGANSGAQSLGQGIAAMSKAGVFGSQPMVTHPQSGIPFASAANSGGGPSIPLAAAANQSAPIPGAGAGGGGLVSWLGQQASNVGDFMDSAVDGMARGGRRKFDGGGDLSDDSDVFGGDDTDETMGDRELAGIASNGAGMPMMPPAGGPPSAPPPQSRPPIPYAGAADDMPGAGSGVPSPSLQSSGPQSGGGLNPFGMDDKSMAMLEAGLGMMASPAHFALQGIGQGGLEGLKAYQQQKALEAQMGYRQAMSQAAMTRAEAYGKHIEDADHKPVIDNSGPTIRLWQDGPNGGEFHDTGIPTAQWQNANKPNYVPVTTGTDTSGQPIVTMVNSRNPSQTQNVQGQSLRGKGGPGSGGGGVHEWMYNSWLSVHPDDKEGALEYASGHKQIGDADAAKVAEQQATAVTNGQKDSFNSTDEYDAYRDKQFAKIFSQLKTGAAAQRSGGSGQQPQGGPANRPAPPPVGSTIPIPLSMSNMQPGQLTPKADGDGSVWKAVRGANGIMQLQRVQ